MLRPRAGVLRPTESGSAMGPRPPAGASCRTLSASAGRGPPRGPAWFCDAPPVTPPPPAASADPSDCAVGRCPRALARPGPAVLGPLPAQAAAGPLPPPLLGPRGTAASAPVPEETARGRGQGDHAHRVVLPDSTHLGTGPSPFRSGGFPRFPPFPRPVLLCFSRSRSWSNPAVLGVFVGSGLEKGAGGPGVVHGGGPVQRGFS